ncbi:MAG: hypothetical protein ACRC3J_05025 [Culicoidibacterales bacterium]
MTMTLTQKVAIVFNVAADMIEMKKVAGLKGFQFVNVETNEVLGAAADYMNVIDDLVKKAVKLNNQANMKPHVESAIEYFKMMLPGAKVTLSKTMPKIEINGLKIWVLMSKSSADDLNFGAMMVHPDFTPEALNKEVSFEIRTRKNDDADRCVFGKSYTGAEDLVSMITEIVEVSC